MGLYGLMNDPAIPDEVKQEAFKRASAGAKREFYYEKYGKRGLDFAMRNGLLGPLGEVPGVRRQLIPEDLQSAGSLAGSAAGSYLGAPFLGAEAGGTLGGMAQGRSAGDAAMRALPGALLNRYLPKVLNRLFATRIAQQMSSKASSALAKAAGKLFRKLNTGDVDETVNGLVNFYGSGNAGSALERAGSALGNFRRILRTQPAFQRIVVRVPIRSTPSFQGAPVRIGWHAMPLNEAMDYLDQLYNRGNIASSGMPRGGIMAEPDRRLGAATRKAITDAIGNVNPRWAKMYQDLSHDYGVAMAMQDVFTKDIAGPGGTLDHERLYNNAADKKVLDHLNNLVGPDDTRQFLQDVTPGRMRIQANSADDIHSRLPVGPIHVGGPKIKGAPQAPAEFTPLWPKLTGLISSQTASQGLEKATANQ